MNPAAPPARSGADGGLSRRLAPDALGIAALRIGAEALNFVTSVALARVAGLSSYGAYTYAMALITLLVIPATGGLPAVAVRDTAAYRAREQWGLMRGLWRFTVTAVLLASLVTIAVAFLGVRTWSGPATPGVLQAVLVGLPLVPLVAMNALRTARLRGLHRILLGQLPEQVLLPAVFLALIGVAASWDGLGPAILMGCQVTAAGAAVVAGGLMLRRVSPARLRSARPEYDPGRWVRAAIPLLLADGAQRLSRELGVAVVGSLMGAESAGVFRVASRGADIVGLGLVVMSIVVGPTLAGAHATGDHARLERVARWAARLGLLWALPIAAILTAAGGVILALVFGEAFASGAAALAVLSLGQLVNAATGPISAVLAMTGLERGSAVGHAGAAIITLGLGLALVPALGVTGAAVASTAGLLARNAIMVSIAARRLPVRVWGV